MATTECSACHSRFTSTAAKTVSKAYDRHRTDISSKSRALNILLVVGDCILVGLQPILVYMSKVDEKFKFSPISVNFLTEATKVLFALVMLLLQARHQKVGEKSLLSISTFVLAAQNNALFVVPALLYAINNYLKFIIVTRNYFENLVRALESGLADVDARGACSRSASSKSLGGRSKARGGRSKGTPSSSDQSCGSSRNLDDSDHWSCEYCTFANIRSATVCQMCQQRR